MDTYFYAKTSSLNQSWFCEEGNTTKGHCFFSFYHQFERSHWASNYVEGFLLILLSLAIVPANALALYRFSKKKLYRQFFLLLALLCVYNVFMALTGIINGFARFNSTHPLGIFGCRWSAVLGTIANTATVYTMALISYERNCALVLPKSRNSPQTKLKITIIFSILIFIFSFVLWSWMFYVVDIYKIGPDKEICIYRSYNFPTSGLGAIFFFSISFVVPLAITSIYYGKICIHHFKLSRRHTSSISDKLRQQNFQISILMALCLVEFILFQIPLSVIVGLSEIELKTKQFKLQSTLVFISFAFLYLDCFANPLWISYVSLRKKSTRVLIQNSSLQTSTVT